jgi:hypothetical protein
MYKYETRYTLCISTEHEIHYVSKIYIMYIKNIHSVYTTYIMYIKTIHNVHVYILYLPDCETSACSSREVDPRTLSCDEGWLT